MVYDNIDLVIENKLFFEGMMLLRCLKLNLVFYLCLWVMILIFGSRELR